MGLFKKKMKKRETPAGAPDISNIREGLTLLGRNLKVNGTVSGEDDVQLLGAHIGDFDLKGNLNIHQSANIVGNVKADTISVGGTVEGNVTATKKINILNTASIEGNISTPAISIQEGAQFNGKVSMDTA
jgi:cytoskeletal protein CcmA (bactofilin family)